MIADGNNMRISTLTTLACMCELSSTLIVLWMQSSGWAPAVDGVQRKSSEIVRLGFGKGWCYRKHLEKVLGGRAQGQLPLDMAASHSESCERYRSIDARAFSNWCRRERKN